MSDATIRNIISQEFRALQQRLGNQTLTKADMNSMIDRMALSLASKRDMEVLKNELNDIKFEIRSQKQTMRQHALYIEALNRDARNNTTQLGTLWRFVQQ